MSETAKLLTVIVPSYNMEAYLPKCLGSLVGVGREVRSKNEEGRSAVAEAGDCEGEHGTQTPSAYAEVRPDLCACDPRNTADGTTASGRVCAQTTNSQKANRVDGSRSETGVDTSLFAKSACREETCVPESWRRAAAEAKVAEWLEGVDEATFEAALVKLVEEKSAAGEYRFKRDEERELALEGARRFYREFSRKLVPLSDGRFVYFAPDPRARLRNASNAISWAEYAFHAVSNGGAKVSGKTYNERWYNPYKIPVFEQIESVLRQERCFIRLSSVDVRYDAIVFAGTSDLSRRVQVVTRLDEVGNIDTNLSEVTFTASSKEKKLPRLVPLAEAVRTVVHYQTTAGSYPPNEISIAHPVEVRKGDEEKKIGVENRCTEEESRFGRLEDLRSGGEWPCRSVEGESGKVGLRSRSTEDRSLLDLLDVIVVNDGSKDRTSEIAHDFERRYPGVFRVIDKPNGHYGSCINAALPLAKGRYVKVLDADDWMETSSLSEYLRFLQNADCDLVVNDFDSVDPDGRVVEVSRLRLPTGVLRLCDVTKGLFLHHITYRTGAIRALGGYHQTEGIAYTDTEWRMIPMLMVESVRHFPRSLVRYLVGRDGQTMNPATFAHDFWMMEKTLLAVARAYEELPCVSQDARQWVYENIYGLILFYYDQRVNGFHGVPLVYSPGEFDRDLALVSARLHQETAHQVVISRKLGLSAVDEVRNHSRRCKVTFSLYRCYCRFVRSWSKK